MIRVRLQGRGDGEEWRSAARALVSAAIAPEEVSWSSAGEGDLFGAGDRLPDARPDAARMTVPARFVALAEAALCHSDPARFALLYRLLWRLKTEPRLLDNAADPDIARATRLERSVRRDCHKMTAFVRFREVEAGDTARRRFAAWFEPDHYIVRRTAGFFRRRFADMDWLIATPKGASAWDGTALSISDAPAPRPEAEDQADVLWKTYYAHIFNPARLKTRAMQAEMPKKYWKNLPEAALIPGLIAGAPEVVRSMAARPATEPPLFHHRLQARAADMPSPPAPEAETLDGLRDAARGCTGCGLHRMATGTVFGEGRAGADILFVGEQPGDQEDLAGRPFVGPAGRLLDRMLEEAGIDRRDAYVTNAVKHFKYEPRGKRRLHRRPDRGEVTACRWWLDREIALVGPRIVVALGATAFFALTGETGPVGARRGQVLPMTGGRVLIATIHPSYLLRLPDAHREADERRRFADDLARVASVHRGLRAEQTG
ncbi:UdgX family uracil-DNA binding protein [Ensifer soli]|uniref:UdgX family uracil-DNA binding protein n=1 Tax=Ciceribacter sp. sgz301302 TaxID=3342379 RepID=UPI0035B9BF53